MPQKDLEDRWLVPYYKVRRVIRGYRRKCTVKTIRELCAPQSGVYIEEYVQKNVGKPYLRVDNIREFICNLNEADVVYVSSSQTKPSRVIVRDSDVLLARTGTLGKASLARQPIVDAVMSQHITSLRVQPGTVHPGYLAAFLNSEYGKTQIINSAFGSTRPELTHAALGQLEVPIIGEAAQQEIGDMVRRGVDRYYESLDSFRLAVRTYEKGVGFKPASRRTLVFEGALSEVGWTPRYHRPEYQNEINRLRRNFHCKQLGEIAGIERGKGTRVSEYSKSGLPFVRTTSLINFGIDPFPDHYATEETYNEFAQEVEQGDILFSIEGKPGAVALLCDQERCVYKNHIVRIRIRGGACAEQLFLYLACGSGQYQTNMNTVIQAILPGLADRACDFVIPVRPKHDEVLYTRCLEDSISLVRQGIRLRTQAVGDLREAKAMIESRLQAQ
jgi:hypothetical protein